eukprot:8542975-Pyramimonas_sp.AAC.1
MAKYLGFLVLALGGDTDGANVRLKFFVGSLIRERILAGGSGVVAILDVDCATHVLMRLVVCSFGLVQLIPSLHATAFTSNQSK